MEQKNESQEEKLLKAQKLNRILTYIGVFVIFCGVCLYGYYLIIYKVDRCTSSPMQYLTEETIKENGWENLSYSYAKVYLYSHKGDIAPMTSLEFELK